MSGSRTTRKVTIDSGRRISSSGDLIDQPTGSKAKSVFDRLGTISKHGVKKTSKSNKYSDEESYNSDEGEHDKKKGFVSFTVKKNSLMEESENKLNVKKDKKKVSKEVVEESTKLKKKKKFKEENQPIALYSKPKKNTKDEVDEKEPEQPIQKKKKKASSPDMQPTKKKRRLVEDENSDGDEYEKKNKSKGKKKIPVQIDIQTGSDNDGKEKKKKKKPKEGLEPVTIVVKKTKKQEDDSGKVKKKYKMKSSDDDVSEEERITKKRFRKQRSASWSVSEDEEEEEVAAALLPKSKRKNRKAAKQRRSVSESPYRENLSSLESDISLESDDEHKKKGKRTRNKAEFVSDFKPPHDRQYRKNHDHRQLGFDARHHREDFQHRKRNDSFPRDDGFNEHAEDRRRMNQYERVGIGYERVDGPGGWRPGSYDERNRRMEEGRFDGRNTRGRAINRFVNRDDRGIDHYDRREDGRLLNDYRGPDSEWNRQANNYDEDRYQNRMNYRGRGRGGRGRGNFRGGYYQQNEPARYNQQRDYDYRSKNPSHERMPHEMTERFSKQRYRGDDDEFRSRNDHREKEQKYELSPLRGPNLIGTIVKRKDLSSDSDEEEEKTKKRKTSEKKKKPSKEDLSVSDVSDTEQKKKKQKSKVIKTVSTDERKTSSTDERKTSSTDERKTTSTDERKTSTTDDRKEEKTKKASVDDKESQKPFKEKSGNEKNKEDNNTVEEEKKKEKKVTHKRVSAVKDMEGNTSTSSGRKTPELKDSSGGKNEDERKKERKEEKKNVRGTSKDKRERTDRSKNQDEREKSNDRRKKTPDNSKARSRTPDSRRARSPVRDSPYKRGRSPERRGRHRDTGSKRDSKDFSDKREKSLDKTKGGSHNTTKNKSTTDSVDKVEDVYESISDEELDLFDENDEDYKLPKPASVMDVDWSMLSNMNKVKTTEGEVKADEVADYLQKLLPGRVLTEIGYSPTLLSEKTFQHVQSLCLKATDIQPESLDVSEKTKLKTGMAATVKNVLKQRRAFDKLFTRELIGLRNDLALRRELRKPADKIGTNYNVFCSAPANPVDYDVFLNNVAIYEKKQVNEGDPLYVTAASKVGSVIACKS